MTAIVPTKEETPQVSDNFPCYELAASEAKLAVILHGLDYCIESENISNDELIGFSVLLEDVRMSLKKIFSSLNCNQSLVRNNMRPR